MNNSCSTTAPCAWLLFVGLEQGLRNPCRARPHPYSWVSGLSVRPRARLSGGNDSFFFFCSSPPTGLSSSAESLSHFQAKPFRKDLEDPSTLQSFGMLVLWAKDSLVTHPKQEPQESYSQGDGLGNVVMSNYVPSKEICLAEPCSSLSLPVDLPPSPQGGSSRSPQVGKMLSPPRVTARAAWGVMCPPCEMAPVYLRAFSREGAS